MPHHEHAAGRKVTRVFTVDSFAHGIAIGQHRDEGREDPRDTYALRLVDDAEMIKLRGRYTLHQDKPYQELERHLQRLSRRGALRSSTIYLGTTTDPFHPFEGRFDASMKFLELFKRFEPGMLHVQTRSSLIVLALPVLQALGKKVSVTMAIETNNEHSALHYTPGFPRVEDRFRAAAALRRFGVEVKIQVGPVLPYGDWRADAALFAGQLAQHADYVHVFPLSDGTERKERKVRSSWIAKRLAVDRKFHWLRPDAANPLITALEEIAPEKLRIPERNVVQPSQMSMFVA